jgi:hypothetical protein
VLIRVKSVIRLKRVSEVLTDVSYRVEISGDGATVTVRVIEYFADIGGREVPEMFCLVTGLRTVRTLEMAVGRLGDRAAGS